MAPRPQRSGVRHSIALFLLAVFLGSGTSLPSADALLYHWGAASAEREGAHIEPAGGCGSHTESCALGRVATGSSAVLTEPAVVRGTQTASTPSEKARTPSGALLFLELSHPHEPLPLRSADPPYIGNHNDAPR
jgi:hypothetical protein